ncbi:MAG TPA: flippase activity-associated protein Agl23 [Thermomicrobiales bacterium]|nr:flippase activity-associated protein Agl23 [Thermomicrobiales bacterium]
MVTGTPSAVFHDAPATTARRSRGISIESLVWIILIAAACITRFWNLEYRTLHHDESIHTYYSWFFTAGTIPYVHNPLSHGPFLFHANALVYFLFGDSDATSRFLPALAGVLLVAACWLLRGNRFLGHWGALAAGFMLLISPSFLYYTRYIRHDPYTCLGALLLTICIFRYIERPQRRWMFTAFLTVAFLLTNHEIAFAILLAFVGVIFVGLLWGALRPLVPVVLATGAAGVLLLVARRLLDWPPMPDIPWNSPTSAQQSDYYQALLSNPFIIGAIAIGIGFLIASWMVMRASVRQRVGPDGYLEAIFGHSKAGSLERGVYVALKDWAGLMIGLVILAFTFFAFFTTLFTNLDGIASSTYATDGTLLYWLGQHDERRGNQPWFYFITESFQYEWLTIFLCTTAVAVVLWRVLKAARGDRSYPRLFFAAYLLVWFGFLFAVLSWAGEKMPWLIMHFLLPGILLGALLFDEIMTGAIHWYRRLPETRIMGFTRRQVGWGMTAALLVVAGSLFLAAARLTYGVYGTAGTGSGPRSVTTAALNEWWLLALLPLVGLVLVGIAYFAAGWRHTANIVIVTTIIVTSLYQVHAGFRLAFLDGDIAKDTLIYNTTAPDIKQMDLDLTELSWLALGDDSLEIGYNSCTAWPLTWYFRDNPGARQISQPEIDSPATLPPIVIANNDSGRGCTAPTEIPGYTAQPLVLRWHEPEYAVYRMFAIAPELSPSSSAWQVETNPHGIWAITQSIWDSVMTQTTPEGNQRLFRLLFFRENPEGLNPYRFTLFIRDDMLPYYNDIRYGE